MKTNIQVLDFELNEDPEWIAQDILDYLLIPLNLEYPSDRSDNPKMLTAEYDEESTMARLVTQVKEILQNNTPGKFPIVVDLLYKGENGDVYDDLDWRSITINLFTPEED